MTARRAVASPCNRQCTLDSATDQCLGCYRTLDEICAWTNYSDAQRQAVLDRLAQRRVAVRSARADDTGKN